MTVTHSELSQAISLARDRFLQATLQYDGSVGYWNQIGKELSNLMPEDYSVGLSIVAEFTGPVIPIGPVAIPIDVELGSFHVFSQGVLTHNFDNYALMLQASLPAYSGGVELHFIKGGGEDVRGSALQGEIEFGIGYGIAVPAHGSFNNASEALSKFMQLDAAGALMAGDPGTTVYALGETSAGVGAEYNVLVQSAWELPYYVGRDLFRLGTFLGEGTLDILRAYLATSASSSESSSFSLSVFQLGRDAVSGTAFENFLPSTLLSANGGLNINWDWSTVSFNEASLAVPVQGGSFDYITVPGISVVDATGNFTGTFAQTSDGIPIFQIAADSYGITQTAFPTDGGGVRVITNNGSVTGQLDYSGPVGTTADPFTYFGNTANLQLQDLKFTDNTTSEVIGQGKYIKGGNTKTGGDAIVAQVRDATTGVWQTTVTVNRPEPGLTPEQQEALIRQAIADIIAGDGLVVDADGAIAHVTGTLLRASDAGSDATWIEPDAIDAGGVLMRTAPVLGWRTYNFTVEGLHTYVAANDNTSPEVSRAA